MKLIDLKPKWTVDSRSYQRHGMGLSFQCPKCGSHRLAVFFENPVDGGPKANAEHFWKRTGEHFSELTLEPSIDATVAFKDCWHGFITNGEIK